MYGKATAITSPNIALIKYWGNRDERLMLPNNSSISMTLGDELTTKTKVIFDSKQDKDQFYINGKLQDLSDKETMERFAVINKIRSIAGTNAKVLISSENSFPTSAGLASSASGIAAMVLASTKALDLKLDSRELSIIAKVGSGSACRSLFGGFVKWERGQKDDGTDSYARQIAGHEHWPELVDIVAVVSDSKKKVSSRAGMRQTVKSSLLYKARPEWAENMCVKLEDAILKKDFGTLAEITMKDSSNLHAVMLDTYPSLMYLNDTSKEIMYKIAELNESEGKPVAAYTFDAGANANIITRKGDADKVMEMLSQVASIKEIRKTGIGKGPRFIEES